MHPDPTLLTYLAQQSLPPGSMIQTISRIAVGADQYTNTYTRSDDSNHAEVLQLLAETEDVTRTWLAVVCPSGKGKERAAVALYYEDRWFAVPTAYIAKYPDEVEVLNMIDADEYDFVDWDAMFPDSQAVPLPFV